MALWNFIAHNDNKYEDWHNKMNEDDPGGNS